MDVGLLSRVGWQSQIALLDGMRVAYADFLATSAGEIF